MNRRSFFHRVATPQRTTSQPAASTPAALLDDEPEGVPRLAAAGLAARPYVRPELPPPPPLAPLKTSSGLEPYAEPLDRRRAAHLLRRTGIGARATEVDALAGLSAEAAAGRLVDAALAEPLPPLPAWVDEPFPEPPPRGASDAEQQAYQERRMAYLQDNLAWAQELRGEWVDGLYGGSLRERLALLWHNHFVTESEAYARLAVISYRYLTLLRLHALGNFKTFVHAVGRDASMLVYLNGNTNTAGEPNENYARELLELFTMGQTRMDGTANYTQQDIEEIARALTGWIVNPFDFSQGWPLADGVLQPAFFVPPLHDTGAKTLFGRTGTWGYDDVVDLLFEERAEAIAEFVAARLYRAFVYAAPQPDVVAALADVLLANDFELAPAVRALLQSAHFFDAEVIGAQVKSPIAATAGLMHELTPAGRVLPQPLASLLNRFSGFLQQSLFDPPNVAGWPGHHAWLDTTTMPIRWLINDYLVFASRDEQPLDLVPLAEAVHDPTALDAAFQLPFALAQALLPVPVEQVTLDPPDTGFAGDLAGNPLPQSVVEAPQHVRDLALIFLAGVPWYEWSLYLEQSNVLLAGFVRYLVNLPEYQLA